MIRDVTHFIEEWCEFGDDRAYILMAIARRKFNEDVTNAEEKIHRRVLTEQEDVEEQVRDLVAMMEPYDLNFRLYLTVNAHDTVSAYHSFMQTAMGWSEELLNGHEGTRNKLGKISSEWKSVLHKPQHKVDSFFLMDYDEISGDEVGEIIGSLDEETTIRKLQETPNGYHLITEPFNYTEWESPVEYDDLDTDGMVHVAEISDDQILIPCDGCGEPTFETWTEENEAHGLCGDCR